MKTIEHYPEEQKQINRIMAKNEADRQERLAAAEAYIKEQKAKGLSREEIYKPYVRSFYQDFDDSPLAKSMTKKQRHDFIRELIYTDKILKKGEDNMDVK